MAARRLIWQSQQMGIDANHLVFLDETGAKTNFTRTHGRALLGQRLVEKVPHGHWLSTTFVAGLRLSGWVAPLTIDGALNGELFRLYVEQHLAPVLQPGDLVVMETRATKVIVRWGTFLFEFFRLRSVELRLRESRILVAKPSAGSQLMRRSSVKRKISRP